MTMHRFTTYLDDPSTWPAGCSHQYGTYAARRPADVARAMLDCDPSGQYDRGVVCVDKVQSVTDLRWFREYAIRYADGTLSSYRVWVRR